MIADPADQGPPSPERALIEAARVHAAGAALPSRVDPALPAEGIPGYQILHEIHRGGQGVVYRAHQLSAGRTVAIKVMHEGPFAGAGDRARFEREVRILGALRHPNIVAIHDSGQASGHFYYVMDYIAGQSLEAYLGDARMALAATLRLFLKICDAVNAAHLRGIVHRDLKPGNIRVDAAGEPYILDFGLARGAGGFGASAAGAMTVTGQFIGSLQWASPEQTEGIPDRVDLRTDVYSLGVILYHMLTGKFPYDVASEMWIVVDQIRRADPVRPRLLRRDIDDDLETIVLKCLQKDRERRYQTAGELAKDVRHYLAGEAIEAKRDSSWYVLRKAMRRHRGAVAVAVTGVLGLAVFSGVTYAMYRTAERERERAELQKSRAVQTVYFLRGIFESIDPDQARGLDKRLILLALEGARKRVASELADQPDVAATLLTSTGYVLIQLGMHAEAEADLRAALALRERVAKGEDDPEEAVTKRALALTLIHGSPHLPEAQRLLEEAIAAARRHAAARPEILADCLLTWGQLHYERDDPGRAKEAFAEAIELVAADATQTRRIAASLLGFWRVAIFQSDFAEADRLFQQIRRRFPNLRDESALASADALYLAGLDEWTRGRAENVRGNLEASLKLQEWILDNPRHPRLVKTLDALGLFLTENASQSERGHGAQLLRRAIDIASDPEGGNTAVLADALYHYGSYLKSTGDLSSAREELRKSLAISAKELEKGQSETFLKTLSLLASIAESDEGPEGANALFQDAFDRLAQLPSRNLLLEADLREALGERHMERGRFQEGSEQHAIALELRRKHFDDHPADPVGRSWTRLGMCLTNLRREAEAANAQVRAVENYEAVYPWGHEYVIQILSRAAASLTTAAQTESAEVYASCAVQVMVRSSQAVSGDPDFADLVSLDEPDEWMPVLLAAPAPIRLWLGKTLAATRRFEVAETVLLSLEKAPGCAACLSSFDPEGGAEEQAMRDALLEGRVSDALTEALWSSLADLYREWGRPEREAVFRRQFDLVRSQW